MCVAARSLHLYDKADMLFQRAVGELVAIVAPVRTAFSSLRVFIVWASNLCVCVVSTSR